MNDRGDIYRELQQHLDRQAVGFPATESGVELRLLERCFDPAEAEIALGLSYRYETVDAIFERLVGRGLAKDELAAALNAMVPKGIIGFKELGGERSYRSWPLSIGFWEGQLGRLTPELLADFREYSANLTFGAAFLSSARPQMRTIPVEASLDGVGGVEPFDRLETILERAPEPITVTDCICRKARAMEGQDCRRASGLQTCLSFGDTAAFCLEARTGREIDRDEALTILRRNQREGLVLQPSNTLEPEFICSCCACCCGILEIAHRYPRPVEIWATNFHAAIEEDACDGCGTCAEACQARAIKWIDATASPRLTEGRCIGCGQCVASCPEGAIRLEANPEVVVPPATTDELLELLMAGRTRR